MIGAVIVMALLLICALPEVALGASAKVVTFHGYRLTVPASWPVFRLANDPTVCVRFDRHAVYLGQPSGDQHCPAQAAGRTEAILVQPLGSRPSQVLPATGAAVSRAGRGAEAQILNTAQRVLVTATWNHRPAVIQRALGVHALAAAAATAARLRPRSAVRAADATVHAFRASSRTASARATAAPSQPGQIYTGLGFDACTTPSSAQMSAWGSSPYRALGVYIGGANMACSQPNLSATWVSQQSIAGWHLIPTYVGLQAPGNSCGCASISAASASAQGTAAAQDAVADAQAIGLGAGNPLYFDMEAYNRGGSTTSTVLAFLSAWTTQLHASGYQSGVYSSEASGINDLVAQVGTGYTEPDDIWIANWNGSQSTADSNVPSQDWAAHERLHQYQGAHNETYSGVKINIDGDYLDAATAAAGTGSVVAAAPPPAPAPSLSVTAGPDGSVNLTPSWTGATGVTAWQVIAGASPTALTWIGPTGAHLPIVTRNVFPYFAVNALGATGQVLGTSTAIPMPPRLMIFGQSAFVPRRGLGAVPIACVGISPCAVTTTISSGRTTFATTHPEFIAAGGGLAYFKLSSTAQKLLARAHNHQLPVNVRLREAGGRSVMRKLTLSSFSTTTPSPPRSIGQSSQLKLLGTTEFVSHGWAGGILAECVAGAPCQATVTLVSGGRTIVRTSLQTLGAGELGYLGFSLTPAGHKLLTKTKSNQLGVTATITSPTPAGTPPSSTADGGAAGTGGASPGGSAGSTSATGTSASARLALVAFQ
jgi:glycoside hydrolase-like protein